MELTSDFKLESDHGKFLVKVNIPVFFNFFPDIKIFLTLLKSNLTGVVSAVTDNGYPTDITSHGFLSGDAGLILDLLALNVFIFQNLSSFFVVREFSATPRTNQNTVV